MSTIETFEGGSLTVEDTLGLECMRGTVIRAGAGGLRRTVLGVNIIEVPDAWRWLRAGELVFSAGYPWREEPVRLVELVAKLAKADVAGVVFKLGQYLKELPGEVLQVADELGFPVLQLPPDRPYRDVLESVYRVLVASVSTAAEESLRLRFLRFGLDEQSVEKVASALAAQFTGTVYVLDRLDDLVLVADGDGAPRRRHINELPSEEAAAACSLEMLPSRRTAEWIDTAGGRAVRDPRDDVAHPRRSAPDFGSPLQP